MRHILFLLISVALHGAILSYPLALRLQAEELVPVVVVMSREANEPGGERAGGAKVENNTRGAGEVRGRANGIGVENSKKARDDRAAGGAKQLASAGAAEQAQAQARKERLSTILPGTRDGEPEQEARDAQDAVAISTSARDTPGGILVPSAVAGRKSSTAILDSFPRPLGEGPGEGTADQADAGAILPTQNPDHKSVDAAIKPSQMGDDPVEIHGLGFGSSDEFSTRFERSGGRTANYHTAPPGRGSGGGSSFGPGGGRPGTGLGAGSGSGDGSGPLKFVQVRYAQAPRPEYPEQARREGKEGRVLLRVLVDEQGRSTSAEVNQSSGSAALDLAAIEAIRRWRFWPARYGNEPVQSWVRIPIEFRLSEANH